MSEVVTTHIKQPIVGTVVSDKMNKTVVVAVKTRKRHPKYHKSYTVTKRYKAHDEQNAYHVGDVVAIMPSKPLSRGKHFKVVKKV